MTDINKLTDEQIAAIRDGCESDTMGNTIVMSSAPGTIRALASELLERRAAEKRWRDNSRETFEAMVAMRNYINEHIPLPSIESDLARGPGSGVFCAEVAQGVVTALAAKDTEIERLKQERDEARAVLWSIAHDRTDNGGRKTRAARYLAGRKPRILAILGHKVEAAERQRDEALADAARLREALEWYGEQARLCRLIHSEGEAGRNALASDGGDRARAALTSKDKTDE